MTERLADVSARLDGIRQLDAVVNAMAGIAAARARQARGQIVAVDSYAATIAAAMGQVATMAQAPAPDGVPSAGRPALVLFCAEQGFAGAYSERVFDAVGPELESSELFLIGSRGEAVAASRGVVPGWSSAMTSHPPGVPKLADRIVEALYARISIGEVDRLDAIFSRWQPSGVTIERHRLFPVDLSALPEKASADVPLLNLPAEDILVSLAADYVHALICNAALHAFAAENEARMVAMAAARTQIEREISALQATERQVRQEAITAEIIELATGELASRAL